MPVFMGIGKPPANSSVLAVDQNRKSVALVVQEQARHIVGKATRCDPNPLSANKAGDISNRRISKAQAATLFPRYDIALANCLTGRPNP